MLIFPPTFSTTRVSVTTASMSSAGVTSNAGLGARRERERRSDPSRATEGRK